MWTRKSQFLILYFQKNSFRLPIVLPLCYFTMIVDGVQDISSLFKWINDKWYKIGEIVEVVLHMLKYCINEDLVDIDVSNKGEKIKIKWMMR